MKIYMLYDACILWAQNPFFKAWLVLFFAWEREHLLRIGQRYLHANNVVDNGNISPCVHSHLEGELDETGRRIQPRRRAKSRTFVLSKA